MSHPALLSLLYRLIINTAWEVYCDLQVLSNQNNYPANKRRLANVGLMLGRRRRQWLNIEPALAQRLVSLAGLHLRHLVDIGQSDLTVKHAVSLYNDMRSISLYNTMTTS